MAKRFGQQHRDLQRRQAKAQLEENAIQSLFVRPESGCVETRQEFDLEDPDFRVSQRLVSHDSKLVEFALILTRFQGGQWVEMYSIDTEHGMLHEHVSGHKRKGDRQDIHALHTQVDVQESLDEPSMRLVLEKYRRMRS
jgi:hypothetical protein